jgi:hypothetical protein
MPAVDLFPKKKKKEKNEGKKKKKKRKKEALIKYHIKYQIREDEPGKRAQKALIVAPSEYPLLNRKQ